MKSIFLMQIFLGSLLWIYVRIMHVFRKNLIRKLGQYVLVSRIIAIKGNSRELLQLLQAFMAVTVVTVLLLVGD